MIFDKGTKATRWRKDRLFNEWCWNNWTSTRKEINLDTVLIVFLKINPKWVTDIKLLVDNMGENSVDLGFDDDFLDTTPKIQFMKEIIVKLHFI